MLLLMLVKTRSTPDPTNISPKGYFRLIPAIFALTLVTVIGAIYLGITSRGARKETRQLRAEIARLVNRGAPLFADGPLDARTRSTSEPGDSLKTQSENLRQRAVARRSDAESLKLQLAETRNRVKLLESEAKIAETVVHDYGHSVCLLHVVVEFRNKESGRPLKVVVDATGKPLVDEKGMVQLDEDGVGLHLEIHALGTGFLARSDGKIITNHHIVEPWWKDDDLTKLLDQGVSAYVSSYEVYFPGRTQGMRATLDRISSKADLATLQLESSVPPNTAVLELDDRAKTSVTGEPIVLMGYPTGIEGILARQGTEITQKIMGGTGDMNRIMTQLASQRLIRPTTTQGHIGDVLEDKIVYDAATTSGGSGGPLFNRDGKVIGINLATMRGFGGSNLAVPSRYAKELLN